MKQVFVIHGGDTYKTYDEYLVSLQTCELDDPRVPRGKGWKSLLGERLGSGYQVIAPRMPNAANARYVEWKIWFEKHVPFLDEKVVLIGHSLGGCFLARYLSEEKFSKTILGTFLIAAPFGPGEDGHLAEFVPQGPLTLLEAQGGEVYIYHSRDDEVVPFSECEKYRVALPSAHIRLFEDQNHFIGDEIPGLVEDITTLI